MKRMLVLSLAVLTLTVVVGQAFAFVQYPDIIKDSPLEKLEYHLEQNKPLL